MNKKNKNKNRSKPTNPTPPPQKTEPTPIIEEAVQVVAEEKPVSLVKESDSVIDTTSKVVTLTVEENDLATETPKKPKRNKGKKKKQEEANLEETETASIQNSAPALIPISDSEVKVQTEIMANIIENKIEEGEHKSIEENITANVRKKKNKKKTNEQQTVEEISQKIISVDKIEEDVKKEEITSDKVNKCDINTPEIIESDVKQTKKKNKKKKHRHDSEKSDKADEVLVCTAAFQKLLSSTDNESDINPEISIGLPKDSDKGDKNIPTYVKEETLKDLIESVLLPDESNRLEGEALEYEQSHDTKNKKKGKKDKKQQQPKIDTDKTNLTDEPIIQQELSVLSSDIVQESPLLEQVECALKDTIVKTKAKIAKPVEKKRKGKTESIQSHENKLDDEIISTGLNKEPILEIEKMAENLCEVVTSSDINVENIENKANFQKMKENETNVVISDNPIETPITSDIISSPTETQIATSILNLADINIGIKSNEQIFEPSVISLDSIVLKSDKESEIDSSTLLTLDVSEEKDPLAFSEPYKTVEKKKKRHPKKIDVFSEKITENKILITPESESTKEDIPEKHKGDILTDLSTSQDVEISSLKTEEVERSTDVTPDFIHHPLATSQQLTDDNNNMVIRDITATDEKISLHLLISSEPIIQDSGETPEFVEEKMSIEAPSLVIRESSQINEAEKTDLKSKMMEVSQDMEELRLSIERSLAELTSMEKSEQDVDKKIEVVEAPKLDLVSELVSYNLKDETLEENKSLCENVVSEFIRQDTHSISEVSAELIDTVKQEMTPKPESVQEKNTEMPVPETTDEHKQVDVIETPPQAPARKDHKSKGKGKRKGKQETQSQQTPSVSESTTVTASENTTKDVKKEDKEQSEQKTQSSESNKNSGKQQSMQLENSCNRSEQLSDEYTSNIVELSFEPIENFEDALTSSVDDVNKTFEMIANEVNNIPELTLQNPQINITAPIEETEKAEQKRNAVSPPKNLLGHPDIPVQSNRTDYKKEKNKPPNMRQAKVKIKDAVDIEKTQKMKQSKESQTENKRKITNSKNVLESFSYMSNENTEYVYKYSFRKVFLQSLCHVCRKELSQRVPCQFCSLMFYCSQKHKDEDWPHHQSLCFAICTIAHLKDQKHIYADAKNITGQNYRLLRMHMIVSCEKVLKRKLVPWEQEALLYPRICADVTCREWKQSKLADCEGCGQISYCSEHPEHLPSGHQRWCRSYALYQKLVHHQQTRGRLEPKLPPRLVPEGYKIPEKINEVIADMYDEKIDMTDMEYAALTQLATAPLTAAYCHQISRGNHSNGILKKASFVIHIVGAELQFEADVLFKWEVFFLHLKPDVKELKVVLISPDLNPSNLPLDLLGKVNLCESCRTEKRRVLFSFQDKKTYYEYWASDEYIVPDIVCAFNPSIQRSCMYNGKDTWPTTISCILKLKTPFIVSSYSINELNRDIARIKECSELSGVDYKTISDPKCNPFASVRPDRNFITDDETPLLFKNYCFAVLCGI